MTSLPPVDLRSSPALDAPRPKTWTVPEYHRLSELGFLGSHDRTELCAGQIMLKASKSPLHVTVLQLLAQTLREFLQTQPVLILTQDPIQLDDRSEPEPDLVVARGTALDYRSQHPQPADLHLVVEVADSTLTYDCGPKARLYAQAGIADYWVVDVQNQQLHIFRDPTPAGYSHHLILTQPQSAALLAFSACSINLHEIFPV